MAEQGAVRTPPEWLEKSRFPFGPRPPLHGSLHITPDISWFQLADRNAPLGGVNVWAIRDGDGWTIVDTGFPGAVMAQQWSELLEGELNAPITQIICTHHHPDHIGQVSMLQTRWEAPLVMSETEWAVAQRSVGRPAAMGHYRRLWELCGVAAATATEVAQIPRTQIELPDQCRLVGDGEVLMIGRTRWRASLGGGHSPSSLLLTNAEDRLVIVGDQLLPRITPHIGVSAFDEDGDPLGDYFDFLSKAATLPEDLVALPGHGPPFIRPHLRATEIAAHHRDRLKVLLLHLARPRRCIDCIEAVFGRALTGMNLIMGVTEALAHLNHLLATGQASRRLGDDGCYWFAATPANGGRSA